jgi:hypothetical protein
METGKRHLSSSTSQSPSSLVPQEADLLEIYRGLVSLGRIKSDEHQMRVVMEVYLHDTIQSGYSQNNAHSLESYAKI